MAVYTEELAADIQIPHMDVYRRYCDETPCGYRVVTGKGYVMYDTAANEVETNPETGEETPVAYYYTELHCPLSMDFATFRWEAVPRDSVDGAYVFGKEA